MTSSVTEPGIPGRAVLLLRSSHELMIQVPYQAR